ncbi:MAG: adenosylcobinamide-GDP ribazoletransferase [Ramlibacter sp.]|nr:adenosylcobinamide-GDP ribazoletransferase [Ramlibacter sp.]
MNALGHSLRSLLLALQYFTRVPLPPALARWIGFDAGLQRASLAHFPGVGLLVAGVAMACYGLAYWLLPRSGYTPLAAAVLSTAATLLLTGALHEDGLADTADGLGGGHGRERALEIMKDSRIGAFGALALMVALLAKISLLALIGSVAGWTAAAAALLGAHVSSRALVLAIVATLPNVGSAATSKSLPVAGSMERAGLGVGLGWCALGLAGAAHLSSAWVSLAGLAFAAAMLLWFRRVLARRLQGFTGDTLGAAQQLCEIAFYLGAAIALEH